MKYNLAKKEEALEAQVYLDKLKETKSVVEINKKFPKRTYSQNNYVHLLLNFAALSYGEGSFYFKQVIWKQIINRDLFETTYTNPRTKETRVDWKSSADLSTAEMTIAVDRLIHWAAKELSIELPKPTDGFGLYKLENEVEKNKEWL